MNLANLGTGIYKYYINQVSSRAIHAVKQTFSSDTSESGRSRATMEKWTKLPRTFVLTVKSGLNRLPVKDLTVLRIIKCVRCRLCAH